MSRHAAPYVLAVAIATACHGAAAQTITTTVPPDAVVQQLAPQLVAFAGSLQNFQNLVNGLALGTPIQLTSVLPNGSTQLISFNAAGPLTPIQIAQLLESTRQQLIGLGIAHPSAEQIANALAGTAVPNTAAMGATAATVEPPARINTSDSPIPAGATSRTPTPPVATPQPAQPAQMTRPASPAAPKQMR